MLAPEPAQAAAERVAGYADVTSGAVQGGKAPLGEVVHYVGPASARVHPRLARVRVDLKAQHRVGAQEQRRPFPVERLGTVPGALGRDPQASRARRTSAATSAASAGWAISWGR